MNIKTELEAMSKRMFADELLNKILAAHKKELADTGFEAGEQSCAEAGQALAAMLNEGQRKSLAEVEAAHWDSLKYALKFSFTRGVYVGFHQYFADDADADERPFEQFVGEAILRAPETQRHSAYYEKRKHVNELLVDLHGQLGETADEQLTSAEIAWDDGACGTLRYAFYMGYRYALSIIEEVAPLGSTLELIGKTLMTEHELGFTQTRLEQERQEQNEMARRRQAGTFLLSLLSL